MFSLAPMTAPARRPRPRRLRYIVPCRACRKMRMPAGAVPPRPRPARGAAARITGGDPR